jgi:hypothetical protein
MTTSERFLARRGQAWLVMGRCTAVCARAEHVLLRLKVPTRYTAGAECLSRPPRKSSAKRSTPTTAAALRAGGAA